MLSQPHWVYGLNHKTQPASVSVLCSCRSYQLPSLGLSSLPSPDFSKLLSSFLSRTSLGDNYEIVPWDTLCVSGTLRAGVEVVNSGFSAGTWGPSTVGTVSEGLDFELLCASGSLFSLCRLASALQLPDGKWACHQHPRSTTYNCSYVLVSNPESQGRMYWPHLGQVSSVSTSAGHIVKVL